MEPDAAAVDFDGWGVKRLFSRTLRRWLAGGNKPRASWLSNFDDFDLQLLVQCLVCIFDHLCIIIESYPTLSEQNHYRGEV